MMDNSFALQSAIPKKYTLRLYDEFSPHSFIK